MRHLMTLDELDRRISLLASGGEATAFFASASFSLQDALSEGRFPRRIAKGSTQVDYAAVFAGVAAVSKPGAGP